MDAQADQEAQLARERVTLAKAEQDLVEGERRISDLERKIAESQAEGRDTMQAERLLGTFRATLIEWQKHRQEILRTIDRLLRT